MVIHCDTTRYIAEVIENQEYSFLFKDLVVLDIGCNIGTFSLWIYPLAKEIHAIDCDDKVLDLFRKTIKDNRFGNITVTKERILNGSGNTGSVGMFMSGHSIPKVDILKLDVEGDELEIVEAKDFPADKIRTIVGELHYSDNRRKRFKERLEKLGYQYAEYPNNHFIARR